MYKHVRIPTDGSELSAIAEAAGLSLAKSLDAKVTALTVTPPFQIVGTEPMLVVASEPEYEKAQAERAKKTLERVKTTARSEFPSRPSGCPTPIPTRRSSTPPRNAAATWYSWPPTGAAASAR